MTFVEHIYPRFVWGKDISVKSCGEELEVSAIVTMPEEERAVAADPFRDYRRAIRTQKGQGKSSPHIKFANADTDQKLTKFLRQFGPVVVCSSRSEEVTTISGPFNIPDTQQLIIACQNLSELRSERRAYRAALTLISELRKGKQASIAVVGDCVSDIVQNVTGWPQQWVREGQLRAIGLAWGPPDWHFREENLERLQRWKHHASRPPSGVKGRDKLRDALSGPNPVAAGHAVICELVNAFAPKVYAWGDIPVEAPSPDMSAGIRPLLYYILRREYLQGGGIGICRRVGCREIFEIERFGQEFCGEVCSRLQRQKEYWVKRGKQLRKRRGNKRKKRSER